MLNSGTGLLLAGALLAASLAPLGSSSFAVIIPAIASDTGTDIAIVTRLLVGGYLLICIIGQIPAGKLADQHGPLKVLWTGIAVYCTGCLVGFVLHDIYLLAAARMAMAAGVALISPATQALIRLRVPGEHLPQAFGIFSTTMSTAAAAGPVVGGFIAGLMHWSVVFAINLPIALLALVLIQAGLGRHTATEKPPQDMQAKGFDWRGLLLLSAAVCLFQWSLNGEISVALLAGAALLFAAFLLAERRHPDPLVPPMLMGSSVYRKCCLITAINNAVMYALIFQLPILMHALGISDLAVTGSILLGLTVAMMASGMMSGWLMRRIGAGNLLLAAQLLGLAAMPLFMAIDSSFSHAYLVLCMVVSGFTVGFTMPAVQFVALSSLPPETAGKAAGGMGTTRYLGGAIGISVMSLMLEGGNTIAVHREIFGLYLGGIVLLGLVALSVRRHANEL